MWRTVSSISTILLALTSLTHGYSGGSGTPEDPYQIATAQDLIDLGNEPNDYNKQFIMTADIDLDPNLPGGRVFNGAVITSTAPDPGRRRGHLPSDDLFQGVFNGNDHVIYHLTIEGQSDAGLFSALGSDAQVLNLGLEQVTVLGTQRIGALIGYNEGTISNCYSTGTVSGDVNIGGLVGSNYGSVTSSYSTAKICGERKVGGLVGYNRGSINSCFSTAKVNGQNNVGGLVGYNFSDIISSYSTAIVSGEDTVGGLVGYTEVGSITSSYSTGTVSGDRVVGGLVGVSFTSITSSYSTAKVNGQNEVGGLVGVNYTSVTSSFWDTETSGLAKSDGGTGLNTNQMQDINTYLNAGWDFIDETDNGSEDIWFMPIEYYPGLTWAQGRYNKIVPNVIGMTDQEAIQTLVDLNLSYSIKYRLNNSIPKNHVISQNPAQDFELMENQTVTLFVSVAIRGSGSPEDPYQIATAEQLRTLGKSTEFYDQCFVLTADINLDPNLPNGQIFNEAVIAATTNSCNKFGVCRSSGVSFQGVFDGNGHVIYNLKIEGQSGAGLFGVLGSDAHVLNLGLEQATVLGTQSIGALISYNEGTISNCYSTGIVIGNGSISGGLVGYNKGLITYSYNMGIVSGNGSAGGLVGTNMGDITSSYNTSTVSGNGSVGGLVGTNRSRITSCNNTGTVSGHWSVGGLVGSDQAGDITSSYSIGAISGGNGVGGLVGYNQRSRIISCYSTGTVNGEDQIGGLVGYNGEGSIISSYSTNSVTGLEKVGGLVGVNNYGHIIASYNAGSVSGDSEVGGLVGTHSVNSKGTITHSFWDTETSGQTASDGGIGLTTVDMQDINTYLNAGWDFLDETVNGTSDFWILQDQTYPTLTFCSGMIPIEPTGSGTVDDPYLLTDANELGTIWYRPTAHYCLTTDIDLSSSTWNKAIVPNFSGTFDGDGHVIRNINIVGFNYLGLFGILSSVAEISSLGLESVNIHGGGKHIGGLVGYNYGSVTSTYSTGTVSGDDSTGGLVGYNYGHITSSYSTSVVSGDDIVGGLVGNNSGPTILSYSSGMVSGDSKIGGLTGYNNSRIASSYSTSTVSGEYYVGGLVGSNFGPTTSTYSTGTVSGDQSVGGLVGSNSGLITSTYSTGMVSGNKSVGGLVGNNNHYPITSSYSTGMVSGESDIGGLVGSSGKGLITFCFWNTETSGQVISAGGTGLTTYQMQNINTFLNAGWDLVDESANGTSDFWIHQDQTYPRLASCTSMIQIELMGSGTADDPYLLTNAKELGAVWYRPSAHYRLTSDINLSGSTWNKAVIPFFSGNFAGSGHVIRHLHIEGGDYIGLFGLVLSEGGISSLGLEEAYVYGSGKNIGGLVGCNRSSITSVYSTGSVNGNSRIGGLVGYHFFSSINSCYSMAKVNGEDEVGGLVGYNRGSITSSYSTGKVSGDNNVGGLVGNNESNYNISANFWDIGNVPMKHILLF